MPTVNLDGSKGCCLDASNFIGTKLDDDDDDDDDEDDKDEDVNGAEVKFVTYLLGS